MKIRKVIITSAIVILLGLKAMAQENRTTVVDAERNSQTIPYAKNMLVADGRKVFRNGIELQKNEVQRILANTDMLRQYNKGLTKNKNGNNLLITGGCLLTTGIALVSYMGATSRSHWNGTYHEYHYDNPWSLRLGIPGIIMIPTGIGLGIYGIVLKTKSAAYIMDAVNLYNTYGLVSTLELKFGFTGNGLGIALMF